MSNRRRFIKSASFASLLGLSSHAQELPTPKQIEGPFYPRFEAKDKDFDLTQIQGQNGVAKGTIIHITGKVLDLDGSAIEDATVDLWQANAAGRYRHPHDDNKAPIDPYFQGWAIIPSSKDGSFKFKTILPGAYPIGKKRMRPPHIHFKVSKKDYHPITTQMYFPNNPLNQKDKLLQKLNKQEQALLIAKINQGGSDNYEFNIYLKKI
ncbi:protocatechuate 3,4-dioxygenase [Lentisphaera profundi]|uniref:Protocatechuate 3,4-dioxygenase n=1 Tax=Lentisphaera profundi TaxID=1658616 RepID=A0ABY7VYJ0_9BACT|nr:protocatechuate 3,4-dioxygenase [Lentisphaera profundi]WDE99240.1 protocatechuate 3,4-dioxygenase [Lentisphaera profundi]